VSILTLYIQDPFLAHIRFAPSGFHTLYAVPSKPLSSYLPLLGGEACLAVLFSDANGVDHFSLKSTVVCILLFYAGFFIYSTSTL
jgi:hypothetical protein